MLNIALLIRRLLPPGVLATHKSLSNELVCARCQAGVLLLRRFRIYEYLMSTLWAFVFFERGDKGLSLASQE